MTSTPQRSDVTVSDATSPVKSAQLSKGSEETQGSKQVLDELDESAVSTPSSPGRQLIRQKAVEDGQDRPELVNRDSQLSDISVFESEIATAEVSEKMTSVQVDDSIEVLVSDADTVRMRVLEDAENIQAGHAESTTTGGSAVFRGDNIRISVTRPSPVREIPGEITTTDGDKCQGMSSKDAEFTVMEREGDIQQQNNDVFIPTKSQGVFKEAADDRSRHSTGSSIQVINEHSEEEEEEDFLEANLNEAIRENRDMNKMVGSSDSSLCDSEKAEEREITESSDKIEALSNLALLEDTTGNVDVKKDHKEFSPDLIKTATLSLSDSTILQRDAKHIESHDQQELDIKSDSISSSSKEKSRVFQSVSCDFALSMTSMPQPIRNVGPMASDGLPRPGQLPDNKVDAFVKTVHFLKHQSPDTKGLDSRTLEKNIASLKTLHGPDQTPNTSATVNVQFSNETIPTGKQR